MKIKLNRRQMANLALYNIGKKKLEKSHPLYQIYKELKLDGRYSDGRNKIKEIAKEHISNYKEYNFKYCNAAEGACDISIYTEYEILDIIGDLFENENEDKVTLFVDENYYFGQSWGCIGGPIEDLTRRIVGFSISATMYICEKDKSKIYKNEYEEKIKQFKKLIKKNINCPVNIKILIGDKDWDEFEGYTGSSVFYDYIKPHQSEFFQRNVCYNPNIFIKIRNFIFCLVQDIFWELMEIKPLYAIYEYISDKKIERSIINKKKKGEKGKCH